MNKVADLLAVAKDLDRFAADKSIREERNDPRIGRPSILPRTVEIEKA